MRNSKAKANHESIFCENKSQFLKLYNKKSLSRRKLNFLIFQGWLLKFFARNYGLCQNYLVFEMLCVYVFKIAKSWPFVKNYACNYIANIFHIPTTIEKRFHISRIFSYVFWNKSYLPKLTSSHNKLSQLVLNFILVKIKAVILQWNSWIWLYLVKHIFLTTQNFKRFR